MISKVVVFHCPECNGTDVVKNGKNSAGSQQFLCKDCRKSAVMYPQNRRSEEEQDQILSAYHERLSMRWIARTYHVSRNTLKKMLKKGSGTTFCQRKPLACRKRRCAGIRRGMVICLHQNSKILVVDSSLLKDTPDCCIWDWWSKCRNLPALME